jgi:threonine/homoserine/homoserine lactone efflux protein
LVVGILTTALNPGFFVWWMTVGAILISIAVGFGLWILVIFALIHWSCDFIFDYFVTFSVHRTKHLWSEKTHKIVFGTCGVLLLAFGIWFIISSVYPYL